MVMEAICATCPRASQGAFKALEEPCPSLKGILRAWGEGQSSSTPIAHLMLEYSRRAGTPASFCTPCTLACMDFLTGTSRTDPGGQASKPIGDTLQDSQKCLGCPWGLLRFCIMQAGLGTSKKLALWLLIPAIVASSMHPNMGRWGIWGSSLKWESPAQTTEWCS